MERALELAHSSCRCLERVEVAIAELLLEQATGVTQGTSKDSIELAIDYLCQEGQRMAQAVSNFLASSSSSQATSSWGGKEGWRLFYEAVEYGIENSGKEYYSNTMLSVSEWKTRAMNAQKAAVKELFSDLEGYGSRVDLSVFFKDIELLIPSVKQERKGYAAFLAEIKQPWLLSRAKKFSRADQYIKWLTSVIAYLRSFVERKRPLCDISALMGSFPPPDELSKYWSRPTIESELYVKETSRLFENPNTMASHLKGKDYAKAAEKHADFSGKAIEFDRRCRDLEFELCFYCSCLGREIQAAVDHCHLLESGGGQYEQPSEELADGVTSHSHALPAFEDAQPEPGRVVDDAELSSLASAKGVPIGPDGQPIPHWIYKLHGLQEKFACEICGDASYWGRRAFEKHFSELRHTTALKLLGIPNTSHFTGVTSISDARKLFESIVSGSERALNSGNSVKSVECEDRSGNVLSYQVYEDLAKQGLL